MVAAECSNVLFFLGISIIDKDMEDKKINIRIRRR
jgi:hypothetical protein